jgi:5'-nucleotidase
VCGAGSVFVHRMARQDSFAEPGHLDTDTHRILHRERGRQAEHAHAPVEPATHWRLAASRALHGTRAPAHYRDHIGVTEREHMSAVDCFDGAAARGGAPQPASGEEGTDEGHDLLTIHPEVDGRLEDVGRA